MDAHKNLKFWQSHRRDAATFIFRAGRAAPFGVADTEIAIIGTGMSIKWGHIGSTRSGSKQIKSEIGAQLLHLARCR
jgi:hypothetical protein